MSRNKVIDNLAELYSAENELWGEEWPPSDHLALLEAAHGYCLDIDVSKLSVPEVPSDNDKSTVCFLQEPKIPWLIRRNLPDWPP